MYAGRFGWAAQAVADPRTETGFAGCCAPVLMNVMAGSWLMASVCRLLTMAILDNGRHVREEVADPGAVPAVAYELEHRRRDGNVLWPESCR